MSDEEVNATREEAERLATLTVEDQRAFVAMLKADAKNPKLSQLDRVFSRERANALERILKLKQPRV